VFLSRLIKHAISSHSESQSEMDRDLHSQVEKVRRNTQININVQTSMKSEDQVYIKYYSGFNLQIFQSEGSVLVTVLML
jgi:hypothetical protein